MTYDASGAGALDYFPCRIGQSRLLFRGPLRAVQPGYVAALGGSATYGRFVAEPWPQRLERACGQMVLNLGVPHAGPDAWLNDAELLRLVAAARFRVVQVPGAVNLSNRFYSVHPRRNDRFLRASPALRRLYPDVDFTDFAFTRHLIRALAARGPERFAELAEALSQAWLDRMGALLSALPGRTVLLWFAAGPPPQPGLALRAGLPPLVDRPKLLALRPHVAGIVEVVAPDFQGTTEGKVFAPLDLPAAMALPGPGAHQAVADALCPWMRESRE